MAPRALPEMVAQAKRKGAAAANEDGAVASADAAKRAAAGRATKKARAQEGPSQRLFVGNLPFAIDATQVSASPRPWPKSDRHGLVLSPGLIFAGEGGTSWMRARGMDA